MNPFILLVTPPFTQLNTPYPATSYIKGFLNKQKYPSFQADLGIEVILEIFSSQGLKKLFNTVQEKQLNLTTNCARILALKNDYVTTIDAVICFLQHKNPTLAYTIEDGKFLPRGNRFNQSEDLDWAFGTMGIQDRARHLATLYLEDLSDFIKETTDPYFGFSRYAERLGRSATSFNDLQLALQEEPTFTDTVLTSLLDSKIKLHAPSVVCLSVPFPGNLYSAFRCGKFIKENYPTIKIIMGGGYPNTELRSLRDVRVFDYIDYITLDDGERPLLCLLEYLKGTRHQEVLKRTFTKILDRVVYINGSKEPDFPFTHTGTPDYKNLLLSQYLSVIEIVNPMHRLWSDGRWNKLTMAHGCYWKKCSFCDISLDYINKYDPVSASLLCDRMEELVNATGETGFHFVDEAAPPALMRDLAIEIVRRKLSVTWWTNIRFEQRFTSDVCRLLKASGCIAVSGGLEVASDRLLAKMQKGVTVTQVARVAHNFTQAGIMVHAYLMYGFPTQSAQETVDSLEMVRQLFENGVLQSGFWHLFAMTAHSPVGMDPAAYGVVKKGPEEAGFANNDYYHEDPTGCDHEQFSEGLRKALYNYMHGIGFEVSLHNWFSFKIPRTSIPDNYIEDAISLDILKTDKKNYRVLWLGNTPTCYEYEKQKKGKSYPVIKIRIETKQHTLETSTNIAEGNWICSTLAQVTQKDCQINLESLSTDYEENGLGQFEDFKKKPIWTLLRKEGLLLV